jgi:hypothetical protein
VQGAAAAHSSPGGQAGAGGQAVVGSGWQEYPWGQSLLLMQLDGGAPASARACLGAAKTPASTATEMVAARLGRRPSNRCMGDPFTSDRRTPFGYDMRNVTRSGHAATAGPRSNGIWTAFSRDQQITSELRAGVQPASLRGCSRRASTSHEHPQERRAPRPRPHRCHRLVGREARRGDAGGEILDLVLLEHATSTTFDGLAICSQMATLKPCSSRRCT